MGRRTGRMVFLCSRCSCSFGGKFRSNSTIKKMRARDPEPLPTRGTICTPVQMPTADGKNAKNPSSQYRRIVKNYPVNSFIQKAEPFKRWLAQVGRERIEETIDPEQAIDRALETYQKKGYDTGHGFIRDFFLSEVRNELYH